MDQGVQEGGGESVGDDAVVKSRGGVQRDALEEFSWLSVVCTWAFYLKYSKCIFSGLMIRAFGIEQSFQFVEDEILWGGLSYVPKLPSLSQAISRPVIQERWTQYLYKHTKPLFRSF